MWLHLHSVSLSQCCSINSNAYKLCFWIMAYILFDPLLYSHIRAEVDEAVPSHGRTSEKDLISRLENCKLLVAVYNEMLRFITASAFIRSVSATTDLGDTTLSPGANVLIPYRQLHFDQSVFGDNTNEFDPSRFLFNPDLNKSPSFRPFGGGTTYCAGRHVARREVITFVAMAIHKYDIKLAGCGGGNKQSFPRCDLKKPSLGVLPPARGEDVEVVIGERIHS